MFSWWKKRNTGSASEQDPILDKKISDDIQDMDLMIAAEKGDIIEVERLLSGGVNPNLQNKKGHTALMISIFSTLDDPDKMVSILLKYEANVDLHDKEYYTALTYAALRGFPETTRLLVEQTKTLHPLDYLGRTPHNIAAGYAGKKDEPEHKRADYRCVKEIIETAANLRNDKKPK